MHVGDSAAVQRVAHQIASYGLRDPSELSRAPLDDDTWSELLVLVCDQRLSGLLRALIRSGLMPITDAQEQESRAVHRRVVIQTLGLEQLLVAVCHRLAEAEIEVRVLKGAAHARLLYSDPSERPYADVDLLVHGCDFGRAVAVLDGIGIVRPEAELRPGFDERFGKGATLRTTAGVGVDLHRTFLSGPFAMTVDADGLFQNPRMIDVGGTALGALGREELLMHACFHAALADAEPRILSVRDVVSATRDPLLDLDRLWALAEEWRASAALALGVRTSWSLLRPTDSTELVDWSVSYAPTKREQSVLKAYQSADRRWAHQAAAALPLIHGLRAKAAYARAISTSRRKRSSRS